jgi:large subunit ribosomal protein L4
MKKESTIKLEANVYSQEGKEVAKVALSPKVFGVPFNATLVHDVVLALQSNARANTAHTKDRSEVRGGGKKPWKQKGTGRARHGSSRSPIWSGGGVAHGPRNERDYGRKINKNARAKALACAFGQKFADAHMIFVDTLSFPTPKAKDARAFIHAVAKIEGMGTIATKKRNAALVILPDRDPEAELSFRNFGNMRVTTIKDVNLVELLTYKYVVVAKPEESQKALEARVGTKTVRKAITAN